MSREHAALTEADKSHILYQLRCVPKSLACVCSCVHVRMHMRLHVRVRVGDGVRPSSHSSQNKRQRLGCSAGGVHGYRPGCEGNRPVERPRQQDAQPGGV